MKRVFVLAHAQARQNALQFVAQAPAGYCVTVSEPTRSLEQNAKLHALFSELARKAKLCGRSYTANQWKTLMISGHAIATGLGVEMVPGVEGEFVNIRESSASMTVARMTSLIEYIHAWGAQNGAHFGDQS